MKNEQIDLPLPPPRRGLGKSVLEYRGLGEFGTLSDYDLFGFRSHGRLMSF